MSLAPSILADSSRLSGKERKKERMISRKKVLISSGSISAHRVLTMPSERATK